VLLAAEGRCAAGSREPVTPLEWGGPGRTRRPLRVGFDGRALTSPAAGVRRYSRELLDALAALGEPIELVILGGSSSAPAPAGAERIAESWHPPTNVGWSLVGLPRAVRRGDVDLLHAPAYTAPFWSAVPVVLTIHDVSYARHPAWFPYRQDALRRAFYRRCALGATIVITDSEFSASEIQAAYGIDRHRIVVVPLGVDGSFQTIGGAGPSPLPAGVSGPYVLHVGDLHERRNLPMVVAAVLEARRHGPLSALRLVLAGVDRGVGDEVAAVAARAGMPDALVRLGSVEEEALRALYRSALALVYPSRYEGFGLPLLEAMACGTPVLASRAASIPEVVGDAGLLLNPHDSAEWTEAIVRIAGDETLRGTLRASGLARAATFTWSRTARQTLEVYRRVVGSP
jgi:glycosyltransferase involved in cell wall biosynthesis